MPCNINQNSLTVLPFNHLDDCSFNIALYEMAHGPLHFDADRLDTLLFNPIDESHLDYLTQNLDPNFTFPRFLLPAVIWFRTRSTQSLNQNKKMLAFRSCM